MAIARKALIVWRNRMFDSGINFSPTTGIGDHVPANLAEPDLSKFWRATPSSGKATLQINRTREFVWDFAALLNARVTPHQNLLRSTDLKNATYWTETRVGAAGPQFFVSSTLSNEDPVPVDFMQEDGTPASTHFSESSVTMPIPAGQRVVLSLYFGSVTGAGTRKLRVRLYTASSSVQMEIDLSGGAINSSALSGTDFSDLAELAVESVGVWELVNVYRAGIAFDWDATVAATLRLQLLDGSYNDTYNGGSPSSVGAYAGGLLLQQRDEGTDAFGDWVPEVNGATGSLWRISDVGGSTAFGPVYIPHRDSEVEFSSGRGGAGGPQVSRGLINTYHRLDTPRLGKNLTLDVSGQVGRGLIDVGGLVIGRAFVPSLNIHSRGIEITPGGGTAQSEYALGSGAQFRGRHTSRRSWRLRWRYQSSSDLWADWYPAIAYVGTSKPVFIALNPAPVAENPYEQEQSIYGYVQSFQSQLEGRWNSEPKYTADLAIEEAL